MTHPTTPDEHSLAAGITVKEVAARAGVSTATVSRVLSGKGGVRKELEARVRAAVEALNYHPNQAARRLRERNARIIGLLVPDIQIPFFASTVVGIEKILQEAGYLLLLGNTYDSVAGEQAHINTFLGEDVSGIIFAAANASDISNYRRLQDTGIPLVAIDRAPGDLEVDTVQSANIDGAYQAAAHLVRERHRQIAMITGPGSISTAIERQAGYETALAEAGLPVRAEWIRDGDYTQDGGYQAMCCLLEAEYRPTAVLIANNVMTLGALKAIHERAIDIPGDISIISFDDMPWAASLRPALSVVAQPVYEIGKSAAQLMLARIREPQAPTRHVTLDTRLLLRSSCRCGGNPNFLDLR
jgi:DNA-binding LacI/PurR family transcriptional regulator